MTTFKEGDIVGVGFGLVPRNEYEAMHEFVPDLVSMHSERLIVHGGGEYVLTFEDPMKGVTHYVSDRTLAWLIRNNAIWPVKEEPKP